VDEPTHLDADGRARMVDVAGKPVTERTARAACSVACSPGTVAAVTAGDLPKGDVAAIARLAGIQAAKRTPELIPLCHTIALTSVDVEVAADVDDGRIGIVATARATDRTGVEMEALTAAAVAALTVYDMIKSIDRGARITDLRLLEKTGGSSGTWRED
jgi:cyclic pyranopterin monophosphate synthase